MEITKELIHQKLKGESSVWNYWIKELEREIPQIQLYSDKPLRNTKIGKYQFKIEKFPELNLEKENFDGFYFTNLDWKLFCKEVEFTNCKFSSSNFNNSIFINCKFENCAFYNTFLMNSNLNYCVFENCRFRQANLSRSELFCSKFIITKIINTNIMWAKLIETKFVHSELLNCKIFGSAIWNLEIDEKTITRDLVISKKKEAEIRIDNLEIAPFVYLLLNNKKIRDVITTLTSKLVLILGRFTSERLKILTDIKEFLALRGYVPILFTFEGSSNRDTTETIQLLANISKIVIADITDAKSIPQELSNIIPFMPSLPVQPIILEGEKEYGMFERYNKYPWVNPIIQYSDSAYLMKSLTKLF